MVAVLLSVCNSAKAIELTIDGIKYTLSISEMTARVVSGEECSGNVIIPSNIEYENHTFPVVELMNSCFDGCPIDSIYIGENVTTIGGRAFRESTVSWVHFPDGITRIGGGAFSYCNNLERLDFPDGPSYIPSECFLGSENFCYITIPPSVTWIGNNAFQYTSIESITLPNTVTEVGSACFEECSRLTEVQLSSSMQKIENYTFYDTNLKSLIIGANIEEVGCAVVKSNFPGFTLTVEPKSEPLKLNGGSSKVTYSFDCETAIVNRDVVSTQYYSATYPFQSVKHLVVGNQCKGERILSIKDYTQLKTLTIGPAFDFSEAGVRKMTGFSNLDSIMINSEIPPECPDFSDEQLMKIRILVPKGALDTYKKAEGWKQFWNLEESDKLSAVSDVMTDSAIQPREEYGRYDLSGRKVTGDFRGVVVVKYTDGSTAKVLQQ
ncbi:MAG: leucine-rich repeat domain-containing protein [Bacteroidales bacterium]|nr:leucine-rich repeat domain-containing protein [Bacteroidales bacterium]